MRPPSRSSNLIDLDLQSCVCSSGISNCSFRNHDLFPRVCSTSLPDGGHRMRFIRQGIRSGSSATRSARRWQDDRRLTPDWSERSRRMCSGIEKTARVVDLGAGRQYVRKLLPSVDYLPIDVALRSPDTIVCDLNGPTLPQLTADWVFGAGIIEYIDDVPRLLRWCCEVAPRVVISYASQDAVGRAHRARLGYRNNLTRAALGSCFMQAKLNLDNQVEDHGHLIFWLSRRGE